jgi:host factor-I protein
MSSTTGNSAAAAAREEKNAATQKAFLDELIRNRTRVAIFLVNGVKLEGEIKSYDRYVILMKNAVTDKVYKHAVSTIMPASGRPTATDYAERQPRPRRPSPGMR